MTYHQKKERTYLKTLKPREFFLKIESSLKQSTRINLHFSKFSHASFQTNLNRQARIFSKSNKSVVELYHHRKIKLTQISFDANNIPTRHFLMTATLTTNIIKIIITRNTIPHNK